MLTRSVSDSVTVLASKLRFTLFEVVPGGIMASIGEGAFVSGGIASVWARRARGERTRTRATAVEIFMLQRVTPSAGGVYSFPKPTYTGDLCRSFAMSP